jgi:hypothetical protein
VEHESREEAKESQQSKGRTQEEEGVALAMVDEQTILSIERLRGDLDDFLTKMRRRYSSPGRPVVAEDLKETAARLAETGLVEIVGRKELSAAISVDYLADLSIRFQRLLTFSEKSTTRSKYESEAKAIIKDYRAKLVVPLKQLARNAPLATAVPLAPTAFAATAFVGHSFVPADADVVTCVVGALRAAGFQVETGQRPAAEKVSDKVRRKIEAQSIFVGIFSRRDKLPRKKEWNTSPWVIDEKAYALARGKKLILLKEDGVASIGGIQGDYEYIEFTKARLHELPATLLSSSRCRQRASADTRERVPQIIILRLSGVTWFASSNLTRFATISRI